MLERDDIGTLDQITKLYHLGDINRQDIAQEQQLAFALKKKKNDFTSYIKSFLTST